MKPPSELYDVSESNEITMFLYLDDGSFYNYGKLQVQVSHPDKPVSACCN